MTIALPTVMVFLLAIVQVLLVARDQIAVIHAAREGARAASVAADPAGEGQQAAVAAAGLERDRLAVSVASGAAVRVTVRYRAPTDVPLIGRLLDDVTLRGSASMRREP
jgi:TadE-like protein